MYVSIYDTDDWILFMMRGQLLKIESNIKIYIDLYVAIDVYIYI